MTTETQPTPQALDAAPTAPATGADSPPQPESDDGAQLYLHDKRRDWGLAIRVRERGSRRDYQFRDGVMRAIAGAYEHHLVPVDRPADETAAALRDLAAMSGLTLARREHANGAEDARLITLDEQVALFVETYPGGFEDERWLRQIRGRGQRKHAKGHREPAVEQAAKLLSAEELDRLGEEQRPDEVVRRALQVMESTTLVSAADARPLRELDPGHHRWFAEALREQLHGTGDLELRFTKLLQVFRHSDRGLSWPAATLWLALVGPTEHLCVRPSTMEEQARWMAPTLGLPKKPRARAYERVRKMALALRDELGKRGFSPRDLLDVHDFIWCTLRPAARQAIVARPPMPRQSQVRLTESGEDDSVQDTGTDDP